jgi:hypothetical protein
VVATTELLMINGDRYSVEASRTPSRPPSSGRARIDHGAAWLTDVESGGPLAINPDHVVALRPGPDA